MTIATQVETTGADLEFKSTGVPWATYSRQYSGGSREVFVAKKSSQTWVSTRIANIHPASKPYATLDIGDSGNVWLAFLYHGPDEPITAQATYNDLALATQDGTGGWTTHFVDTRNGAGFRPSIQVRNTGKIRVLYARNYDLVYGTYRPSTDAFRRIPVTHSGIGKRHLQFQPDGSPVASHRTRDSKIQVLQ